MASESPRPRTTYAPTPEMVAAANVKSYEDVAAAGRARTWPASGPSAPRSSSGSRSGTRCWTTPRSPSTSGSSAARPTSSPTASTATTHLAAQQAGADLGRRERRPAHLLLPRPQPRGVPLRQRAAQHGRAEGRPRHHLHGPRARAAHRHAGLRQDRRRPLGGLRRLLGRGAARAHRGQRVHGGHHLRRRLHERQGRRAEEDHGRGAQALRHRRARDRRQAHRPGRATWRPGATTGTTT